MKGGTQEVEISNLGDGNLITLPQNFLQTGKNIMFLLVLGTTLGTNYYVNISDCAENHGNVMIG